MHAWRTAALALVAGTCLVASGCVGWQQARFERDLEMTFLIAPQAGLSAVSENGSVEMTEQARADVLVRAHIRATTQERADAVQVVADSSEGEWLEVSAAWPTPRQGSEGVSFAIEAPGGRKVKARTSNGKVVVEGFSGGADLETSNGSVTASTHQGPVTADTSNGSVTVLGALGPVDADTSNGSVRVELASTTTGPVEIRTSNGGVTLVVGPGFAGLVNAATSNGLVRVEDQSSAGIVRLLSDTRTAKAVQIGPEGVPSTLATSNGSITVTVRQ